MVVKLAHSLHYCSHAMTFLERCQIVFASQTFSQSNAISMSNKLRRTWHYCSIHNNKHVCKNVFPMINNDSLQNWYSVTKSSQYFNQNQDTPSSFYYNYYYAFLEYKMESIQAIWIASSHLMFYFGLQIKEYDWPLIIIFSNFHQPYNDIFRRL